jgi:hypothetical protein
MTEKEAWLYMAEAWDRATLVVGSDLVRPCITFYLGSLGHCSGLCGTVARMFGRGDIYGDLCRRIDSKIQSVMQESQCYYIGGFRFLFPHTLEGVRQRAEFCRQQAALLEPKEKEEVLITC